MGDLNCPWGHTIGFDGYTLDRIAMVALRIDPPLARPWFIAGCVNISFWNRSPVPIRTAVKIKTTDVSQKLIQRCVPEY